jgi:aspartate carbamoyltransferase catalytic subunit
MTPAHATPPATPVAAHTAPPARSAAPQRTPVGPHLLGLQGMSAAHIREYLRETARIADATGDAAAQLDRRLRGRIIANLFFEDSTRTRTSFGIAARRLGAEVVDLLGATSSVNKGETLIDTALNVEAMGVAGIVVRVKQAGAAALIASRVRCPVINAGDGRHEHPTQGLLDLYTLCVRLGRRDAFDLSGVRIAIVGDIAGSRVARSAIAGVTALGGEVVCVGPPALAPSSLASLGCLVSRSLDAVLTEVDAVMMLRIQFERAEAAPNAAPGAPAPMPPVIASVREYRAGYALTTQRAAIMKPGAIVMHPGPINRGIELDGDVADGPRSVILDQVRAGVWARMAALSLIIG